MNWREKNYPMKKIDLTEEDYSNIESSFHFYLDNCDLTQKEQDSILKTMNNVNTHF
tara:strand:- start:930 stop:1097 length:168 start_codon:yes stop_codon:yes gene_type:complete